MSEEAVPARKDVPKVSVNRALAILDLFTPHEPSWQAEAICARLRVSAPTGYRYIRELVGSGLLLRLAGGTYVLGPRIVLLDYAMRQSDPLLHAALPIMRDLVRRTGCDCVLSALYATQIIDTHRETGSEPLSLAYGRGRPRPLFAGAAPKVILAAQPAGWLHKLHEEQEEAIAAAAMGTSWPEFRGRLAEIRRRGFHLSRGELEANLCGLAAPIAGKTPETTAAIAVVTSAQRFAMLNERLLEEIVREAGTKIAAARAENPIVTA